MKQSIQELINALKSENNGRSESMRKEGTSEYAHTVLVHNYNNTLDIIKRLETIVKAH